MRKLILTTLLLMTIIPCLEAQRKEMSQARSYIKSGKDYDKAEKLMDGLLADSANRGNAKIYLLRQQTLRKQYEVGNEKLYKQEKYDTASLFNITKKMFSNLAALDSAEAAALNDGNATPKNRRRSAEELNRYRPNLFFGGAYYTRKADYTTAFSFFDTYIGSAQWPMFAAYDYAANDKQMAVAAYWATFCGYSLGNAALTLRHAQAALADTAHMVKTLYYMSNAYALSKDTANYVATLTAGFDRFPTTPYFFPKLIDYYTAHNELDSALVLSDKALAIDSRSQLFLFAKSSVLLAQGRNDECLAVSDTLISINDTLPDAHYNAGMALLNKALIMENASNVRKKKKEITALYRQAQPYMERFRALAPNDQSRWAPALYRIYLNLNLGKQFDEIDKLMSK